MNRNSFSLSGFILLSVLLSFAGVTHAACRDHVVLVHGNTAYPSSWNNTYNKLRNSGYTTGQISRPSWGSKSCAACNDHSGGELTTVKNAINSAISKSCTGKIDVIGHSMGVTLAAKAIINLGKTGRVDSFVGIAAGYRGLWSCGRYPYHVRTSTCGKNGLSISSPFLDWLYGKKIAKRAYSIKSWSDQIVCSTGTCRVNGVHSSQIKGERSTYSYSYGHFGLQKYTSSKQYSLIK